MQVPNLPSPNQGFSISVAIGCGIIKGRRRRKITRMVVSLGMVVVPSAISGERIFRPNFSSINSVSSSAYIRWWCGRTNLETGVISARRRRDSGGLLISSCLSPDSSTPPSSLTGPKTKLYVSGLSFRTTEDGLRGAFEQFGKLVLVNLVMDKVANRPRGFAFLRYEAEEESMKAIEGMHGKFLDGRVIFVEEAKPRSEINKAPPRPNIHRAQSKPRSFRTW